MSKQSLLQIAKSSKTIRKNTHYKVTKEHIELFIAWAQDEVNLKQAAKALGIKKSNAYPYMLAIAKEIAK